MYKKICLYHDIAYALRCFSLQDGSGIYVSFAVKIDTFTIFTTRESKINKKL